MTTTPIVALDVSTADAADRIVSTLGSLCRFYKIGSELFTAAGPSSVARVRDAGCDVFLDLKLHDIPNTVARAVTGAARLGARLVTVHATGGEAMLRAAVEAAGDQAQCGILAVTILTSLTGPEVASTWGRAANLDVSGEVLRLARIARSAEAFGVVASGHEAGRIRDTFGDSLAVLVPGVRPAGAVVHDQARVVTPAEAARAGARFVVIGRAVTAAPDPRRAMDRILEELAATVA